jgi:hypothetical protein
MFLASVSTARRFSELGSLIGGLGALVIFLGIAISVLQQRRSYDGAAHSTRRRERLALLVGSFLIGVGFLLLLLAARSR